MDLVGNFSAGLFQRIRSAPDYTQCTPVTVGDVGILNTQKGRLVSDYIWAYDQTIHFNLCDSNGNCDEVGSAVVGARINMNGKQSQWSQYSDSLSGPPIKATHKWDCVDDNGSLPNSSCSGGIQTRVNDSYVFSRWTTAQNNYHSQVETYWYKFDYSFKLSGYAGVVWPWQNWRSYKFSCRDRETNPCRFRW